MTPKKKALKLLIKYQEEISIIMAMKCALIAVDEIISINKLQDIESQKYWQEVKQEILNR
jgi:hypothetical protein